MRRVSVVSKLMHIAPAMVPVLAALVLAPTPARPSIHTAGGEQGVAGSTSVPGAETNLFTGALSTSVPILIPPGRRDTTPKLRLAYSSSAGPSPFGFGWDLPLGSIQRSTKHGVPRCGGTDEFVLMLAGAAVELVSVGGDQFQAKVDGSYLEATADTGSNSWVLKNRAGMTFRFGQGPLFACLHRCRLVYEFLSAHGLPVHLRLGPLADGGPEREHHPSPPSLWKR